MSFLVENQKSTAICLVDKTGSVGDPFDIRLRIFDKFAEIIKTLPHKKLRFIFWSDYPPFEIRNRITPNEPLYVDHEFRSTRICGGTYPCEVIPSIPPQWLDNDSEIFLFTDGEMSSESGVKKMIKRITEDKLSINVICIDVQHKDLYDKVEGAVGIDLYEIFKKNGLTKHLASFVSHVPGKIFEHVPKKITVPPGYVPFGDKMFLKSEAHQLQRHVETLAAECKSDDELLRLTQILSVTLSYLTADIISAMRDAYVRLYADILCKNRADSQITYDLLEYILSDSIENERSGTGKLFADFRREMKQFFKQTQENLKENVCRTILTGDHRSSTTSQSVVTLPLYDSSSGSGTTASVITSSSKLIDGEYVFSGDSYRNSSIRGFPFLFTAGDEQPIRQWTRQLCAHHYDLNPLSNDIMYLVMILAVLYRDSEVSKQYNDLATIMMKRLKAAVKETELERFQRGETPSCDIGGYDGFINILTNLNLVLDLNSTPEDIWFSICAHFGFHKQVCTGNRMLEARPLTVCSYNVTETCTICLSSEHSSDTGFFIKSHQSSRYTCSYNAMVCSDCISACKLQMSTREGFKCPVCYTAVTAEGLEEKVLHKPDPQTRTLYTKSYDEYRKIKTSTRSSASSRRGTFGRRKQNGTARAQTQTQTQPTGAGAGVGAGGDTVVNADSKLIISFRGTVGCGKTTMRNELISYLTQQARPYEVISADDCSIKGTRFASEYHKIMERFMVTEDPCVLIIDTCGERLNSTSSANLFDRDLRAVKHVVLYPNLYVGDTMVVKEISELSNLKHKDVVDMPGYYFWSLNNVCSRPPSSDKARTYFLHINTRTSRKKCEEIHLNKFKNIFGGMAKPRTDIPHLKIDADSSVKRYADFLATKPKFDWSTII